jgi:hypothetical protein
VLTSLYNVQIGQCISVAYALLSSDVHIESIYRPLGCPCKLAIQAKDLEAYLRGVRATIIRHRQNINVTSNEILALTSPYNQQISQRVSVACVLISSDIDKESV